MRALAALGAVALAACAAPARATGAPNRTPLSIAERFKRLAPHPNDNPLAVLAADAPGIERTALVSPGDLLGLYFTDNYNVTVPPTIVYNVPTTMCHVYAMGADSTFMDNGNSTWTAFNTLIQCDLSSVNYFEAFGHFLLGRSYFSPILTSGAQSGRVNYGRYFYNISFVDTSYWFYDMTGAPSIGSIVTSRTGSTFTIAKNQTRLWSGDAKLYLPITSTIGGATVVNGGFSYWSGDGTYGFNGATRLAFPDGTTLSFVGLFYQTVLNGNSLRISNGPSYFGVLSGSFTLPDLVPVVAPATTLIVADEFNDAYYNMSTKVATGSTATGVVDMTSENFITFSETSWSLTNTGLLTLSNNTDSTAYIKTNHITYTASNLAHGMTWLSNGAALINSPGKLSFSTLIAFHAADKMYINTAGNVAFFSNFTIVGDAQDVEFELLPGTSAIFNPSQMSITLPANTRITKGRVTQVLDQQFIYDYAGQLEPSSGTLISLSFNSDLAYNLSAGSSINPTLGTVFVNPGYEITIENVISSLPVSSYITTTSTLAMRSGVLTDSNSNLALGYVAPNGSFVIPAPLIETLTLGPYVIQVPELGRTYNVDEGAVRFYGLRNTAEVSLNADGTYKLVDVQVFCSAVASSGTIILYGEHTLDPTTGMINLTDLTTYSIAFSSGRLLAATANGGSKWVVDGSAIFGDDTYVTAPNALYPVTLNVGGWLSASQRRIFLYPGQLLFGLTVVEGSAITWNLSQFAMNNSATFSSNGTTWVILAGISDRLVGADGNMNLPTSVSMDVPAGSVTIPDGSAYPFGAASLFLYASPSSVGQLNFKTGNIVLNTATSVASSPNSLPAMNVDNRILAPQGYVTVPPSALPGALALSITGTLISITNYVDGGTWIPDGAFAVNGTANITISGNAVGTFYGALVSNNANISLYSQATILFATPNYSINMNTGSPAIMNIFSQITLPANTQVRSRPLMLALLNGGEITAQGLMPAAGTIFPLSIGTNLGVILPDGAIFNPSTYTVSLHATLELQTVNTSTMTHIDTFSTVASMILTRYGAIPFNNPRYVQVYITESGTFLSSGNPTPGPVSFQPNSFYVALPSTYSYWYNGNIPVTITCQPQFCFIYQTSTGYVVLNVTVSVPLKSITLSNDVYFIGTNGTIQVLAGNAPLPVTTANRSFLITQVSGSGTVYPDMNVSFESSTVLEQSTQNSYFATAGGFLNSSLQAVYIYNLSTLSSNLGLLYTSYGLWQPVTNTIAFDGPWTTVITAGGVEYTFVGNLATTIISGSTLNMPDLITMSLPSVNMTLPDSTIFSTLPVSAKLISDAANPSVMDLTAGILSDTNNTISIMMNNSKYLFAFDSASAAIQITPYGNITNGASADPVAVQFISQDYGTWYISAMTTFSYNPSGFLVTTATSDLGLMDGTPMLSAAQYFLKSNGSGLFYITASYNMDNSANVSITTSTPTNALGSLNLGAFSATLLPGSAISTTPCSTVVTIGFNTVLTSANVTFGAGQIMRITDSGGASADYSMPANSTYDISSTCQVTLPATSTLSSVYSGQPGKTRTFTTTGVEHLLGASGGSYSGSITCQAACIVSSNLSSAYLVQMPAGAVWYGIIGSTSSPASQEIQTLSSPAIFASASEAEVREPLFISSFTPNFNVLMYQGGVFKNVSTLSYVAYTQVDGQIVQGIPNLGSTPLMAANTVTIQGTDTYTLPMSSLSLGTGPSPGATVTLTDNGTWLLTNARITTQFYNSRQVTLLFGGTVAIDPSSGHVYLGLGVHELGIGNSSVYALTCASAPCIMYSDGSMSMTYGSTASNGGANTVTLNAGGFVSTEYNGVYLLNNTIYSGAVLTTTSRALWLLNNTVQVTGQTVVSKNYTTALSFVGTGADTTMTTTALVLPNVASFYVPGGTAVLPGPTQISFPPRNLVLTTTDLTAGTLDFATFSITMNNSSQTVTANTGNTVTVSNAVMVLSQIGQVSITPSATTEITITNADQPIGVESNGSVFYWYTNGTMSIPMNTPVTIGSASVSVTGNGYVSWVGNVAIFTSAYYSSSTPAVDVSIPAGKYGTMMGLNGRLYLPTGSTLSPGGCTFTLTSPNYISNDHLIFYAGTTFDFTYNGQAGLATLSQAGSFSLVTCGLDMANGTTLSTTINSLNPQSVLLNTGGSITDTGVVTANAGFRYPLTVGTGVAVQPPEHSQWSVVTGYVSISQQMASTVFVGADQTDTFTLLSAGVLEPSGLVTINGTPYGQVTASGLFGVFLSIPVSIVAGPMIVSVPSMAIEYTVALRPIAISNGPSGTPSVVAFATGWQVTNVVYTSGTPTVALTGTYWTDRTGMTALPASATAYKTTYGTLAYSVTVSGANSFWALDGSVYVAAGTIRNTSNGRTITVTAGAFISAPSGTVMLPPGTVFGGITLVSFGSASWNASTGLVVITGACVLSLPNGKTASFTAASATISPLGALTLPPGTNVVITSPSLHMVLAGTTAEGVEDAADIAVLEAMDAELGVTHVYLNTGGVLDGATGNIALNAGTIIVLTTSGANGVLYPGGSIWLADTGYVSVPAGATIYTVVVATGNVIATFTAPPGGVVISPDGKIYSEATGAFIAEVLPNGTIATDTNSVLARIPANCKNTRARTYVVVHRGGYAAAAAACTTLGLAPMILDNGSVMAATALLTSCGGPWKRAYIGGWGAQRSSEGSCMALWNAATYGGSGAVAAPTSCSLAVPILCQRV